MFKGKKGKRERKRDKKRYQNILWQNYTVYDLCCADVHPLSVSCSSPKSQKKLWSGKVEIDWNLSGQTTTQKYSHADRQPYIWKIVQAELWWDKKINGQTYKIKNQTTIQTDNHTNGTELGQTDNQMNGQTSRQTN